MLPKELCMYDEFTSGKRKIKKSQKDVTMEESHRDLEWCWS